MDDEELQYALEIKHKHDVGGECVDVAEVESDISGVSEEGSVYDSEEDRRVLKNTKKEVTSKRARIKATAPKTKFKVCLEDVANIRGPESMLGKSMARCGPSSNVSSFNYPL